MELEKIFIKYPESLQSAHILKNYLLDLFPHEEKLKINLIVNAYEQNIVKEIKEARELNSYLAELLCSRMITNYGITHSNAERAVRFWFIAYGKNVLHKRITIDKEQVVSENGKQEQDEQLTKKACQADTKNELMYQNACEAQKHNEFIRAHELFCKLENYKDSAVRAQRCLELDQKIRQQKQKEQTYNQACEAQRCEQYNAAIRLFRELGSYNDSRSRMNQCKQAIRKKEDEARQQEEKYKKYREALLAYQNKNYDKALQLFGELGSYKDSETMWQLCADEKRMAELRISRELEHKQQQRRTYEKACQYQNEGKYQQALALFEEVSDYSNSVSRAVQCKQKINEERDQECKNNNSNNQKDLKDSSAFTEHCLQQSQKADITEQTNKKPILSTLLIALVINIFMGATVEKMVLPFISYGIESCESGTLVYLFKPILLKEFVILGTQWYGFEIAAIIYGTVSSWSFLMILSTEKWRAFRGSTIVGIVIIILTTLCGVGVMFFVLISEIETSGLVNKFVIFIFSLLMVLEALTVPYFLYDEIVKIMYVRIANKKYKNKKYEESLKIYQWLSDTCQDSSSLASLAKQYYYGQGTSVDNKKAFDLYVKAAKKGSTYAQLTVGDFYRCGLSAVVSIDRKEALEWYQRAFDNGNASKSQKELAKKWIESMKS